MTRIGFIEDDPIYLQSLREAVHFHPDLMCRIAVCSMEEFEDKFPARAALDILFIDIDLPGKNGVEALPSLRKRLPDAELVMLTQNEDGDTLLNAFTAGATGYLLKDFPILQFSSFIDTLQKGGALISPYMARYLVGFFQPSQFSPSLLSKKELQLLRLFAAGNSYERSAELLGISVNGVKYHVKKIYSKLNVNNKIDAIRAVKDEL